MTHKFTHLGRGHTLEKHPETLRKHAAGLLDDAALKRATWYLRHAGKRHCLQTHDPKTAVHTAKLLIDAARSGPSPLLQTLSPSRAQTLAQLATAWVAAGCPDGQRRPRTLIQCERQQVFLKHSIPWFGDKSPDEITPVHLVEYGQHRRTTSTRGPGHRVADLELVTLSNLCKWAQSYGHCRTNPFGARNNRFQLPSDVRHCHQDMVSSDDELHRIGHWLLTHSNPAYPVAGAWWLYCALTGQRGCEPGALRTDATATAGHYHPGAIWTTTHATGPKTKLAVARGKGGCNPAIDLHPALADFLTHWRAYRQHRGWNSSPWLFPDPANPSAPLARFDPTGSEANHSPDLVRDALHAATAALGLPKRLPHAQRAYYVRVRRAMDVPDSQIADELGHNSGPQIIQRTYGSPMQVRGDARFDWLPDQPDQKPCWHHLTPATNLIPLAA